ncbi:MAG: N-6 DNA methylase, partial [Acidobacteriota bacterium]
AQTFFQQWKILFGEVCGYDVDNPSDKMKKLAASYGLAPAKIKPAELLFALHTYYALFMKLLASEIVAFFHQLPTPRKKIISSPTSAKLQREMEDLESGSIFRHLNITNFLEGDLFAWYTAVWTDGIESLVRKMATTLDHYNPGTFSEEPTRSRDLLKKLYQQLFPKSVRHDLGEYYTPDWLAEHVLNELGYTGDPDKRLLDPACGSGTFLVMAITRIKSWFDENREKCSFDEGDLCKKILANVVGFDLNPLAVMAARTNYLIAIRDVVGHVDEVELPIYLCDSILTPAEYGTFLGVKLEPVKELKTAAGSFFIPTDIASNRNEVGKYAEELERAVRDRYSAAEFLQRCKEEGLALKDETVHQELFQKLLALANEQRNGVWARIIKNAFAPLFVGKVDYIVGNPPWVNWESLPSEYREATLTLWDKYRLRERADPGSRLGNVKKELSALFVYATMDHYLPNGGRLGFVITQSIFKSGACEGFRRFRLDDSRPLRMEQVCDLSLCLPFEGAINRTATIIVRKGAATKYPVSYKMWIPKVPRSIVPENSLEEVTKQFTVRDWRAAPVEPSVTESPWLTAEKKALPVLQKVIGDRSKAIMDRAYAGSCTWLNGVFWLEQLKADTKGVLIRNLADVGRKKVQLVTKQVESEFLYPLLRGRDVQAWNAKPVFLIAVAHNPANFSKPVPLSQLKTKFPLTYSFFKEFEEPLRKRSGYKQLLKSRPEFYAIGNVGGYTLAPYKVVFKDLTEVFQCAVVGPQKPTRKVVVPDHTLLFLTSDSENEAHFFCGLLNSIPARVALYGASVGVQTQRYFPTDVSRVRLPEFGADDKRHQAIVRLSRDCHKEAATKNDPQTLESLESQLALAAAALWGISEKETVYLNAAYEEIRRFRKQRI